MRNSCIQLLKEAISHLQDSQSDRMASWEFPNSLRNYTTPLVEFLQYYS